MQGVAEKEKNGGLCSRFGGGECHIASCSVYGELRVISFGCCFHSPQLRPANDAGVQGSTAPLQVSRTQIP